MYPLSQEIKDLPVSDKMKNRCRQFNETVQRELAQEFWEGIVKKNTAILEQEPQYCMECDNVATENCNHH